MPTVHPHDISEVLAASKRWKEKCLLTDGSVFIGQPLWTQRAFEAIQEFVVGEPEAGEDSFLEKLQRQTRNAPGDLKKLLSEMLWVIWLFVHRSGAKAQTKREQIRQVWGWSGEELPSDHAELQAPLEHGVGNPGVAYQTGRWREIAFLAKFGVAVKSLAASDRKNVLNDPWKFCTWVDSLAVDARPQLRHILSFLLFPEYFEPIATGQDKREILSKFKGVRGAEIRKMSRVDVDKQLLDLRRSLEAEYGRDDLSFYRTPLKERWQASGDPLEFSINGKELRFTADDVRDAFERTQEGDWRGKPGIEPRWQIEVDGVWKPVKAVFRKMKGVPPDFDFNTVAARNIFRKLGFHVIEAADQRPDRLAEQELASYSGVPLNLIMYGPPGTGKTFRTIDKALEILDPAYLRQKASNRQALKERFDYFAEAGHVRFVTFHQSFSYEDFVEGIRADSDGGILRYRVADGIFKSLCAAARGQHHKSNQAVRPFNVGQKFGRDYEVLRVTPELLWLRKPNGNELPFPWEILDELAGHVGSGNVTIDDIRERRLFEKVQSRMEPYLVHGYVNILPSLVEQMIGGSTIQRARANVDKWVLIIDEINRGNISRIFGELITLIEPSKRAGAPEALEVILPYSKTAFSVPKNIYIIGTMNTADRSLISLDIALRRRFVFEEMPPSSRPLADVIVDGIDVRRLFDAINDRIEILLDRDHRIGHTYFLPLQEQATREALADIFRRQVLPLLQEYFFEDWERIRWVLNDQRKDVRHQFIIRPASTAIELFGQEVSNQAQDRRWAINDAAFMSRESYLFSYSESAS
jgi:5-methylcytosine-specific restriction enzyme B